MVLVGVGTQIPSLGTFRRNAPCTLHILLIVDVTDSLSGVQVSRLGRPEHRPDQGADPDRGAAGGAAQQGAGSAGGHDEPPQAGPERGDGGES